MVFPPLRANMRHHAKFHQNRSKRLQRYSDLTVVQMAAVRHLGFVKFEFFNSRSG